MKLFSQEKCVSFTWQSWCRVIADYGQFIPTVHDPQRPFGQIWNLTKNFFKKWKYVSIYISDKKILKSSIYSIMGSLYRLSFLFWLFSRLVIFQSWMFLTLGNIAFWLLLLLVATVLPFLLSQCIALKTLLLTLANPKIMEVTFAICMY